MAAVTDRREEGFRPAALATRLRSIETAHLVGVSARPRGADTLAALDDKRRACPSRVGARRQRVGGRRAGKVHLARALATAWARGFGAAHECAAYGGLCFCNVRLVPRVCTLIDRRGGAVVRARVAEVANGYSDAIRVGLARLVIARCLDHLRIGLGAHVSLSALAIDAHLVDATEDRRAAWNMADTVVGTDAREGRSVTTFGVRGATVAIHGGDVATFGLRDVAVAVFGVPHRVVAAGVSRIGRHWPNGVRGAPSQDDGQEGEADR